MEDETKPDLLLIKLEKAGLSDLHSILKNEGVTESSLWTLDKDDIQCVGANLMQRRRYLEAKEKALEEIALKGNL